MGRWSRDELAGNDDAKTTGTPWTAQSSPVRVSTSRTTGIWRSVRAW